MFTIKLLPYCLLLATPAQAIGSASPRSPFLRPACITLDLVRYIVWPSPSSIDWSSVGVTILMTLHWAPEAPATRQILVQTAPASDSSTDLPWWKHWAPQALSSANLTHFPDFDEASVRTHASSPCSHFPPLVRSQSLASPSSSDSSSSSKAPAYIGRVCE